jgi:hypothetical protein
MLSAKSKAMLLGNIKILQYCKETGIDMDKLKSCRVEKMGDCYVFGLKREDQPEPDPNDLLANDLATQPDIVLAVEPDEDGNMNFQTTSKTIRLLTM